MQIQEQREAKRRIKKSRKEKDKQGEEIDGVDQRKREQREG